MTVHPIRSEIDYDRALEMLEKVFDASEGTEEADLRDVLMVLVEKYEEENFPISKPDPVDAIRFRMAQGGHTQTDLAPLIGSRSKVSEVLNGKRPLSLKMIRALNEHLGIPADVLIAEPGPSDPLAGDAIDYSEFPILEMAKNGAFRGMDGEVTREKAKECIQYLISRIGGWSLVPGALYRKTHSARQNANLDPLALQAWQLQVLAEASEVDDIPSFRRDAIDESFMNALVRLSVLDCGTKVAVDMLRKHGITTVIVPHLKKTYVDGAAFVTPKGRAVIGITGRYDRIDNFWFTLMHEIAHIKFHLGNGDSVVDDMTLRGKGSDSAAELEADTFAQEALLPSDFNLHEQERVSQREVVRVAEKHGIHPAIVAGRIQYEKGNYRIFSNLVGRGEVMPCFEE